MSDIRFPATSFPTLTNSYFPPQGRSSDTCVPTAIAPPSLSASSVDSLLARNTWAQPSVHNGAPLISVQANTAAQFTNPSEADDMDPAKTGLKGSGAGNAVLKAVTRSSSRLGAVSRGAGSVLGLAGTVYSLPGSISDARQAIGQAWQSGDGGDIAHAAATTSAAGSSGARLVKYSLESYSLGANHLGHRVAGQAGREAFRQAAPNASKQMIKAAGSQAAKEAMKDTAAKAARRSVTSAATGVAKGPGRTLAQGVGATGRTAAKKLLREGGEAAAKSASKAVAKSALKSGAKAAGRFVPGVNIAIAGLDTAAAAATLADPKASTGKKVTSCITAVGSIAAATNIPVVSQAGAVVSTVSSFVGSFF